MKSEQHITAPTQAAKQDVETPLPASTGLWAIVIVTILGVGGTMYWAANANEAVSHPTSAAQPQVQTQDAPEKAVKAGSVSTLITGLQARLAENPDDAKGWLLLAKSYEYLGDPAEARDAYARAVALGISDIEFEAKLNETWLTDASRRNSRDDLR
jgi:cytochrome c-type biogenesis protein CcmH/NrfG